MEMTLPFEHNTSNVFYIINFVLMWSVPIGANVASITCLAIG